ncbi:MAG: hypothetical protein NTV94_11835 [Planctomycetota bacterium]|nr:hypothetical protein [Planctomycetota bacterium]
MMSAPVHVEGQPIESQATAIMETLRVCLADIAGVRASDPVRAVDIERAFDLDKKLAWQVHRIATSTSVLEEVPNVPARTSIKRLVEAARRRKVAKARIDRLVRAFDQFEEFAKVHGGDRQGLMSMLCGIGHASNDQFELKVRQSLFRAQSHFWGLHAKLLVRTGIFHPRTGLGHVEDIGLIHGEVGLQRVRRSEPAGLLARMQTHSESAPDADPSSQLVRHPLEILEPFCSGPLPDLKPRGSTVPETELVIPAGRTGAQTIYTAQLHENAAFMQQRAYEGRTFLTVPVEAAIWEILVPVGWTDPSTCTTACYARREHPEEALEERRDDLVPVAGQAEHVGRAKEVPELEGSPTHAGAVRHVLERWGWYGTLFDIYRCRFEYPVMHTLLALRISAGR